MCSEDAAVLSRLSLVEKSSGAKNIPQSLFQDESKWGVFVLNISFRSYWNWNYYHDKNVAFRLALKVRLREPRKWSQAYYHGNWLKSTRRFYYNNYKIGFDMTVVSYHAIASILVSAGSLVGSKKCWVIITPPIRNERNLKGIGVGFTRKSFWYSRFGS